MEEKRTNTSKPTEKTVKKAFFKKRNGCPLCSPGAPEVDYKNPDLLSKFISEGARILPMRITNVCPKNQKELKKAIKRARILGLLPFVGKVR